MPALRPLLVAVSLTLFASAAQGQPRATQAEEWQAYSEALNRGATQGEIWRYGWSGVYAVGLGINIHEASEAEDSDDRFDARVGTVKSALALGGTLLDAQPHVSARYELADLRDAGDLREARELMQQVAAEERERRAWQARLDSLIVNTLGGLAIGLGDDRPGDGALNFATGMLVSELQIRTQPTQAGSALNRFQPARLSLGDVSLDYQYAWIMTPNRVGIDIHY
ncbi:hypothetical protein MHM84_09175 [Halomonas sp. McH1-25]|uniref:hypothetical protein n=1 Tax=unclassified Halomonas TaxID=2609666 RepID=UPI001EF7455A|nr:MULTISPECIES: hypothetical protein [unclassified Halomonas]MCG7599959.1 hypothetical protein [Halomonas sp. McH1-25]MCP1343370.1 hypothetical protein [Halomonas sp. FL8]MCP1363373.1 hypothetical protein [Halomonas sp. BBD45]MCP1366649.1 hypothetical protein [Halomonas sp. BBD48]